MSIRRSDMSVRRLAILSAAFAVHMAAWSVGPATAEGPFEFLFGGGSRHAPSPPSQALSSARPAVNVPSMRSSVRFCVRLCDGRFFPIHHADAAGLCNAFCPASKTKVFSGPDIARAVAPGGLRYRNLPTAFAFRSRVVSDCTCNGQAHFGLAPIDPSSDPTARAGDIVAATNGTTTIPARSKPKQTAQQSAIPSASN